MPSAQGMFSGRFGHWGLAQKVCRFTMSIRLDSPSVQFQNVYTFADSSICLPQDLIAIQTLVLTGYTGMHTLRTLPTGATACDGAAEAQQEPELFVCLHLRSNPSSLRKFTSGRTTALSGSKGIEALFQLQHS
jgi:hypothetical protein